MSYDEKLAARIRSVLATRDDVVEKKMFGGLCFMVGGAMCCGLTKSDFMVRVGPEQYDAALAQPHARPMDFTGRPLKGMVYVAPEGLRSPAALARWVGRGVSFVSALPAAHPRPPNAGTRVAALMKTYRSQPKLVAVVDALEVLPKTTLGQHGLTVNGKLFARFARGTLVVKLPADRVAALVAARVGKRCDPERQRLRDWLEVTNTKASWIDLAKEARAFVSRSRV